MTGVDSREEDSGQGIGGESDSHMPWLAGQPLSYRPGAELFLVDNIGPSLVHGSTGVHC